MTNTFDRKMAAVAEKLLDPSKFGVLSTYTHVVRGTPGRHGTTGAPDVKTPYSVYASPLQSATFSVQGGQDRGSASVVRQDGSVFMRPFDVDENAIPEPQTLADTISTGGRTYRVVKVNLLVSGDDVAAYELGLVRS